VEGLQVQEKVRVARGVRARAHPHGAAAVARGVAPGVQVLRAIRGHHHPSVRESAAEARGTWKDGEQLIARVRRVATAGVANVNFMNMYNNLGWVWLNGLF